MVRKQCREYIALLWAITSNRKNVKFSFFCFCSLFFIFKTFIQSNYKVFSFLLLLSYASFHAISFSRPELNAVNLCCWKKYNITKPKTIWICCVFKIKFWCIEAFCREGASTYGFLLLEHQTTIYHSVFVCTPHSVPTYTADWIPTIQLSRMFQCSSVFIQFSFGFVFRILFSVKIALNSLSVFKNEFELSLWMCFMFALKIATYSTTQSIQIDYDLHTINFDWYETLSNRVPYLDFVDRFLCKNSQIEQKEC